MRAVFSKLVLFLAVILLFGCKKEDNTPSVPMPELEEHSILLYMVANNNLDSYILGNVDELLNSFDSQHYKNGNVYIYFDGTKKYNNNSNPVYNIEGPVLMRVNKNSGELDTVVSYQAQNSSSPEVLRKVIDDYKLYSPGSEHAILFSSHGSGWLPSDFNGNAKASPSSLTSQTVVELSDSSLLPPTPTQYAFGQDGSDWFELDELAATLNDGEFDYIIFDACYMGGVEVLYYFKNKADYIVVSPTEVVGSGQNYERLAETLLKGGASLEDRLVDYAEAFVDKQLIERIGVTVSVIDLHKADYFLNFYSQYMKKIEDKVGDLTTSTVQKFDRYSTPVIFDLIDYISNLLGEDEAQKIENILEPIFLYKFASESMFLGQYRGFYINEYCGVSTYIPFAAYTNATPDYYKLQFYKDILEYSQQPEVVEPEEDENSILLYMVADNTLSDLILENIHQVLTSYKASDYENGTVYIYYDGTESSNDSLMARYNIEAPALMRIDKKTGSLEGVVSYEAQNSASPEVIRTVLNDYKRYSISSQRGVLLASHGSGWLPSGFVDNAATIPSTSTLQSTTYSSSTSKSEQVFMPDYPTQQAFGQDGSDWAELEEIASLFEDDEFEYIIFDACYMAGVEVLYYFQDKAHYLLATPTEVVGEGYNYSTLAATLLDSDAKIEDKLVDYASQVVDFQLSIGYGALISLFNLEKAAYFLDLYSHCMTQIDDKVAALTPTTVQTFDRYYTHVVFDLQDYIAKLKGDQAAENLAAAVEPMILYKYNSPTFYEGEFRAITIESFCGVSTYIPFSQYVYTTPEYLKTEFYNDILKYNRDVI